MCALFPACEWPLDAPIGHQHIISGAFAGFESFDDFYHFTFPDDLPRIQLDRPMLSAGDTGDENPTTVEKKLNHNASERVRRRKMNDLYSSLRSMLPPSEQTKRLSIPATVSRMLKYIPELQSQVEILLQKKQQILSTICKQDDHDLSNQHHQNKTKLSDGFKVSPFTVSGTKVSDTEATIQISTFGPTSQGIPPLSPILRGLEEDGLFLTDASCFESFGGRVFYNLNFQVETTYNLEAMLLVLNEKLLSLYKKRKA
ncbi:hypothetical protein Gohar_022179 [Gossypium harknessii]|uniref:BHLH domain-containing protein n=1 Tax=Gossypium harknessii TaxID=34285 RepID=A0A7J9IC23_9ROSI|nr:hypothetical protein [Gossypium harknessii]